MYEEIKNNIIENFFNKYYRYTCVSVKNCIFSDMVERLPFPFVYNSDSDSLTINLGNGVNINFNFKWDERENTNKFINKHYTLLEIY